LDRNWFDALIRADCNTWRRTSLQRPLSPMFGTSQQLITAR
jgi:hypothetical protein